MTIREQTNLISLAVLLVCLLGTLLIYRYTGNVIIAILFAPPIIHWILRRREENE